MSTRPPARVAYVEDAEDADSSVEGVEDLEGIAGTRRYARSEIQVPVSPKKERPNTSKSRGDRRTSYRKSDSHSPSDGLTDNDEPPPSRRTPRESREEREARQYEREQREKDRRRKERRQKDSAEQQQRKLRADAKAAREREANKAMRKTRPTSLAHSRTEPVVQQYRRGHVEDPSCYGVQQPTSSAARPRAHTRPHSYYPGQTETPSVANAGWHQTQPQASFPVGSFPPPPPMYGSGPPSSVAGVPPSSGQPPGFFDMTSQQASAHLKSRFERPASSMGFLQQATPSSFGYPPDEYNDEPEQPQMQMQRRPSRSKKHQIEDDRRRMPPPDFVRPKSAMPPPSTPFRPPPPQSLTRQKPRTPSRPTISSGRSRVGFVDQQDYDDEDFGGHSELFNDMSPDPVHFDRRTALARTRRGSVAYEQPGVDIVPAGSRVRPNSFYGNERGLGSGGVSLEEDKYLTALQYQDDTNGGPGVPLTAETLRKANNVGASSSRSSGSRDESEFRRSNTTGITRSSSSDTDNVTIKVSGPSLVRVSGAEIQCADGSEITFSSRPSGSRVGSDRASTIYQLEDARSRVEYKALPYRARTPSHSETQSRGYAPSHAPYDPSFAVDDYIF